MPPVSDLFRDDSLSGGAKAAWTVFVIVLPFLGVFTYLMVRGGGMGKREIGHMREREARYREAIARTAPPTGGSAEELARLAELKAHGDLTSDEFERAKTKVLTG
ncbi:MAG TPA: PLD nuclease N-terminal domain-containing protein [Spirillospora sp.]|nr:PLD nuclease N-terminal domain-containing protein [Spirillospora sp.]